MSAAAVNTGLRLVNIAVNDVTAAKQLPENGRPGSAQPYNVARALWTLQQRTAAGSASIARIAGLTFSGLPAGELDALLAERASHLASLAAQLQTLSVASPQASRRRDAQLEAVRPDSLIEVCCDLWVALQASQWHKCLDTELLMA